ncbi:hypothetical protein ACOME3_009208 [Neoechinorhynchus agilis]
MATSSQAPPPPQPPPPQPPQQQLVTAQSFSTDHSRPSIPSSVVPSTQSSSSVGPTAAASVTPSQPLINNASCAPTASSAVAAANAAVIGTAPSAPVLPLTSSTGQSSTAPQSQGQAQSSTTPTHQSSLVPMNDLNVEVRLSDDPHTWYKALLEDFDNESVVVSFTDPNMRPSTTKVPFDNVKLMPAHSPEPPQFVEGDKCQVYCARDGEHAQAWHDATIRLVRGVFYMFDYTSLRSGERHNDVLSAEVFRKPDTSPHLERNHLYKYSYAIPEPVPEDMADMSNHAILKARLPSSKIYFEPSKNELVMITNLDKNVKLFHLFADFHLKFIRQKAAFKKSIEVATKRIAVLRAPKESTMGAGHVEVFTIKEGLMGLAIGASGCNITQARNIQGVKHIQTDNDNTIRIFADTIDAAKRARSILEFSEEVIDIPKDKIPRIIGRQGSLIQEMVDRSGVVKVTVEKDSSDRRVSESETTKRLIVRGTVDSIQNMRVLIDYYLEHVESMDEIIAETHHLQQELRSISGNQNGAGFGGGSDHDFGMMMGAGGPGAAMPQPHPRSVNNGGGNRGYSHGAGVGGPMHPPVPHHRGMTGGAGPMRRGGRRMQRS